MENITEGVPAANFDLMEILDRLEQHHQSLDYLQCKTDDPALEGVLSAITESMGTTMEIVSAIMVRNGQAAQEQADLLGILHPDI